MYLEGDVIRIICDNHSAHKSKEVQNYLATKPEGRYVFVFTPKHASWLNLIECFFSKMTKQMLKGIRVKSKQELADRIYQYFDEINNGGIQRGQTAPFGTRLCMAKCSVLYALAALL